MATIEFTKVSGGRYEAPAVGWLQPRSMLSNDFLAGAAGIGELTFRRNWTGLKHSAEDPGGRVRGHHERRGLVKDAGPLEWDDVQYDFVQKSGWKGSFALVRLGEELAIFTPKGFTGRTVEATVLAGAHVPAGLLVFCVWLVLLRQRDSAAVAAT